MRNYLSEMLYALTSAYTRKDYNNRRRDLPIETNIGKLFAILAWGLDSVEKQTELIKLWEDIDYAEGAVLDRTGPISASPVSALMTGSTAWQSR